jgi:hypothetical protein
MIGAAGFPDESDRPGLSVDQGLQVDLADIARRVVAELRPAVDLRSDLFQQGSLVGLHLLRTFRPRSEPGETDARTQAEKYLYVSLRWHLRSYARKLRSSVVVPERDRRLARDYQVLIASTGPRSLEDAAQRLGTRPKRLALALASSVNVPPLDEIDVEAGDGRPAALVDSLATTETSPELALDLACEERNAVVRREVLRRGRGINEGAPDEGPGESGRAGAVSLFRPAT